MAILLQDSLTRANSTTSPGSPDGSGGPYTAAVGTWGINSNGLYTPTSTANAILTYPAAFNVDIQAVLGVNASGMLLARYADANNWIGFGWVSASRIGFLISAGGATFNPAVLVTSAVPYSLRLVTFGQYLYAWVNGVMFQYMDPNYRSTDRTTAGFRISSSTTTRFNGPVLAQTVSAPPGGIDGQEVFLYRGRDNRNDDAGSTS